MKQLNAKIKDNKDILLIMFLIASSIELALGVLDMCSVKLAETRWLLWGFLGIYALQMVTNKWSWKELACLFGLLVMGGMLYWSSGINTGIKAPIFIYALKGMDRKVLFKSYLLTLIIVLIGVMSSAVLFDFGFMCYQSDVGRGILGGMRYSIGFDNPNMLQIVAFWIMIYALYLFEKSRKLGILLVTAVFYAGICVLTASYTGLFVGTFVLVFTTVVSYVPCDRWAKIVGTIGIIMIGGFIILSLGAAADWRDNTVMKLIDKLISGRMSVLEDRLDGTNYELPFIWHWKLFSNELYRNWYDMGYVQIFYYYGIIPACVYLTFILGTFIKAWRKGQAVWLVMMIGLCAYLFMESRIFSNYITRDVLLVIAADMLWRKCDETVDNVDYSSIQRGKVHKAVS